LPAPVFPVIRTLCPDVTHVAQRQTHHLAAIDPAFRSCVDVFNGRLTKFQLRVLQETQQSTVVAAMNFPVDQERQALLEAHACHGRQGQLLF